MLRIQFEKQRDGAVVFRCVREDGTSTWQKHMGRMAFFFPFHDLTHYAVESTFGFRRGFYGLIAEGWEIADTGGKSARGRLPDETVVVEHFVGLFERERVGGASPLTAAEFNEILADAVGADRIDSLPAVTEAQLESTRSKISRLYDELAALQPGVSLELSFDSAT